MFPCLVHQYSCGTNSPVRAIKPLQKKRTQRDTVIKRAPVEPQMTEQKANGKC